MFIKVSSTIAIAITAMLSVQTLASDDVDVITIVDGLDAPWAMEFLPNNDILVTERKGDLRIVRNGALLDDTVKGTPDVYFGGQGGLLDVMLDANFDVNKTLYLSYSTGESDANTTQLLSATLSSTPQGTSLSNQRIIFTALPMKDTSHHFGGRIAQMPDHSLLLTNGDGYDFREEAQTLDNHFGKIIRINQDGSAHKDNPFINIDDAKTEIWSYGHRNPQGLTVVNGVVYENEHGPQGGDEVNIIEAGLNYGWPVITYGIDYNGAKISPFTEYEGMQLPKVDWTPSIAPSSMAYHKGHLYVTSLAERSVRKLSIKGSDIIDHGIVFEELDERMRDIVSAPDGHLYILTDGDNAKILKLQ